ncbi:hypothetical protein LPJ53_000017 [Coemansia erecta]|uniref:Mediator of RNA polymerase II transcription subunit 12 n=1 Tax=Coemansia erecta TaxID=147472 RepID=A0A9W8CVI2_9FUNG|nr:hypothetical protein LPJ53_000017 [Coemansia erecta]
MSYTPAATGGLAAAAQPGHTPGGISGAPPGGKRQRGERTSAWRGATTNDMQPLRKYTATATPGTTHLHSTHAYGFSDFSPSQAGSTQEVGLTERTIRYGHVDTAIVDSEHQSGHALVQSRLQDGRVAQELQAFAAAVAQRQAARGGIPGAPVPRLGTRAVGTDEQRDEWVRALRNPRVPLSTLVARMPYALRSGQLLDALAQGVPRGRALWAIRLAGLLDMSAAQTRAPTQAALLAQAHKHTAAWTRLVMQHAERTLAGAPTAAAEAGGAAAEWAASWAWCTGLLHAQYAAGLVDQRLVVGWLAGLLRQLPVDRCMAALGLAADYAGEIGRSRTPLRKLVAALALRLDQAAAYEALRPFAGQLRALLRRLFAGYPDAFVEPSTWPAYRAALLAEPKPGVGRLVALVDGRNRRFASLLPSTEADPPPGDSVPQPLHVLAALAADGDVPRAFAGLFGQENSAAQSSVHSLRLLCFWAVEGRVALAPEQQQQQQERMLLAAALCRRLDERAPGAVQGGVAGFLDTYAGDGRAVCLLLERLADARCFSAARYLRLLTARGDLLSLAGAAQQQQQQQNTAAAAARATRHLAYATGLPARTVEERSLLQTLLFDCPRALAGDPPELDEECEGLRRAVAALLPFMAAYACAAPLRAHRSRRAPALAADQVRWWLPPAMAGADLLDARQLPTPQHLAPSLGGGGALASSACTHDWLAPLGEQADLAAAAAADAMVEAERLLQAAGRRAVHRVVDARLLPLVYDFVVRDVEVGEDNWRVITQPGSSLLNRRQAAALVRLLAAAQCPAQLLDFLLWLLAHTRSPEVAVLVHRALRRYTPTWRLLGRLPDAVGAVRLAYDEAAARASTPDAFDYDALLTARHWAAAMAEDGEGAGGAAGLLAHVLADYRRFVAAQAGVLLPAGYAPATTAASELVQLARQLVRDPSADEAAWAARSCFQRMARAALAQAVPGDLSSGPLQQQQQQQLAAFGLLADDVANAALQAARDLPPSADPAAGRALRAVLADVCVRCLSWYAVAAGLDDSAAAAEGVASALLRATERATHAWTLGRPPAAAAPLAPSMPAAAAAAGVDEDVDVAVSAAHAWAAGLVACGLLAPARLASWLIVRCQQPAVPAGHFAAPAGMLEALAAAPDARLLHEPLEVSAAWHAALDAQPAARMQAVELVFSAASAAGRLRHAGSAPLAALVLQAAARLAQSHGVQAVVDRIPAGDGSAFYSTLDIYRANIEPQIADPLVSLPAKRAVLRVLMALCEGADPAADGFSAMTTAEVAHRMHEAIRRFWYAAASAGRRPGAHTAVAKLATVVNALLLFAASALQASEASTDAFANNAASASAASGAVADSITRDSSAGVQQLQQQQDAADHVPQALALDHADQVQFVSDATAYLSTCVLDAQMHWDSGCPDALARLPWRSAALADALVTLSPPIILTLVDSCALSLFALNTAHLRSVDCDTLDVAPAKSQQSDAAPAVLDRRVAAIIDAARANVPAMLEPMVALASAEPHDADADEGDADADADARPADLCAPEAVARGTALARTVQQLVGRLAAAAAPAAHTDGEALFGPGTMLAALRDLAAAVLAQLQALSRHMGARAAGLLALHAAVSPQSLGGSPAGLGIGADVGSVRAPGALRLAVLWRLQAVQPLCALMRAFPDEFAVGEWLMTLVTLCLSPDCHETPATAAAASVATAAADGSKPSTETSLSDSMPAGGVLYQYLLDFAAITNESLTAAMRKHTLGLLKSATPLLDSLRTRVPSADVLGRLFPFDVSTSLTRDIVHLTPPHTTSSSSSSEPSGLDNPWMWLEGLDFVPLDSLRTTAIPATGLEGMTPFTLRGTIEQENYQRAHRMLHGGGGATSAAVVAGGQPAVGYLAGVRRENSGDKVAVVRGLQYLENPYYPLQPAFLLPLAETPIEWRVFSAKRRRVDAESRMVWRNQCESSFGRKKLA